jgi:hypothetical protein
MDHGSPKEFLRGLETTKLTEIRVDTCILRAALREHAIQLLLRVEQQMADHGDRLIIQASIDLLRGRDERQRS